MGADRADGRITITWEGLLVVVAVAGVTATVSALGGTYVLLFLAGLVAYMALVLWHVLRVRLGSLPTSLDDGAAGEFVGYLGARVTAVLGARLLAGLDESAPSVWVMPISMAVGILAADITYWWLARRAVRGERPQRQE